MSYNYNNFENKLYNVDDDVSGSQGFDDGSTSGTSSQEFSYDLSGNMIEDLNKNIDIEYNLLNLPEKIYFPDWYDCSRLSFDYDAAGNKIRMLIEKYCGSQSNPECTTEEEINYVGNFVYIDGTLEYIINGHGRITKPSGSFIFEYYITDHLGNVRVVFNEEGTSGANPKQYADYYPFGMRFTGTYLNNDNRYLYNSKEWTDDFGLDWYDYGARFYDPMLGRWHVMDPLSSSMPGISPYAYCYNDAINYLDPYGYMAKWLKTLLNITLTAGLTVLTGGAVPFAAAVSGWIVGTVDAMTEGANLGDALMQGGIEGFTGAVAGTAALAGGAALSGININVAAPNSLGYGLWNNSTASMGHLTKQVGLLDHLSGKLPNLFSGWGSDALSGGISGLGGSIASSGLSGWVAPSGISSGGLATSGRSSISPMLMGSRLDFSGHIEYYSTSSGQRPYVSGNLNWVNVYSNGSTVTTDTWSAVSGPWGEGPINQGTWTATGIKQTNQSGMVREGVGWKVLLNDQMNRYDMRIHPDGGIYFGTRGCIGVRENDQTLLYIYNRLRNYLSSNIMSVGVNW